jgi:chromosome segregation ATPase
MIAGKQKPAQAAQAAQAATATELAAAKAAGDKVLARVNTELAEAAKPIAAADTAAKAVEATAKTAAANVTKLTATVNTAKALIDTRRKETVTAQTVMAKMVTEKQKPMEANLAGMKKAVATAQTAYSNVEKNHTAQMQQLTQTIATQVKTAEVKTAEATKLAAELAKEEARLNELKSTYEKLKTAANGKPTKTAAK